MEYIRKIRNKDLDNIINEKINNIKSLNDMYVLEDYLDYNFLTLSKYISKVQNWMNVKTAKKKLLNEKIYEMLYCWKKEHGATDCTCSLCKNSDFYE